MNAKHLHVLICIFLCFLWLIAGCSLLAPGINHVATKDDTPAETDSSQQDIPAVEPLSPEEQLNESIHQMLDQLSLRQQICQLFIVTPEQLSGEEAVTQINDRLLAGLAQYPVGGIVLFSKNLVDREQCAGLIADIQKNANLKLFIAVDEEGGSVARLGNCPAMEVTAYPPMGRLAQQGEEAVYQAYTDIGREIKALGFNMDFAPVADVNSNPNNPVIGQRAFSSDPQIVAAMVRQAVAGLHQAGVIAVAKHFPGHGDTQSDSHQGQAITYRSLEQMRNSEFLPFAAAIDAGVDMIMAGHIVVNEIEDTAPASLCPYLLQDILRQALSFQGIIITDALNMKAITSYYTSAEAAIAALNAGADILLMPQSLPEAVEGLLQAVEQGKISQEQIEAAVFRILRLKLTNGILVP